MAHIQIKKEIQNLVLPKMARKMGKQKIINRKIFNRIYVAAYFFIADRTTNEMLNKNNEPHRVGLLHAMVAP